MNNPYTYQGPLQDASMFFGRAYELSEIWALLSHNQSVSIVGPDKIGKTSLLLHLMRPGTMEALGIGAENLFVYIDCQALSDLKQNVIIGSLCSETATALHEIGLDSEPALETATSDPTWFAFEAALRTLSKRGLRVVFILDEFDQLTTNPQLDVSLYNALRSVAGRLHVVYLTCSEQPLIEMTYFYKSNKILSSPFFNIFAQLSLGLLSESEARNLIRKPMEACGLIVSYELEDFIYQLVGGHPLALQIACYHAWENHGDLSNIESRTRQALEGYYESCWSILSQVERDVLLYNVEAGLNEVMDPSTRVALHDLTRKCLVVAFDDTYKYPSKAWAEFVGRQD